MSTTRSLMAFAITGLITAGTLVAQPDAVSSCRWRASALTNTPVSATSGVRRGGLSNGNDMVLWKAKLASGHIVTGFCEVSPPTGRVVMLGTDQDAGGVNRSFRMTPGEAERICQREARARFSPGNGLLDAVFLPNTSTRSTYRVEWRWNSMAGTIRKGRCEIDSATGALREFKASIGW